MGAGSAILALPLALDTTAFLAAATFFGAALAAPRAFLGAGAGAGALSASGLLLRFSAEEERVARAGGAALILLGTPGAMLRAIVADDGVPSSQ